MEPVLLAGSVWAAFDENQKYRSIQGGMYLNKVGHLLLMSVSFRCHRSSVAHLVLRGHYNVVFTVRVASGIKRIAAVAGGWVAFV